MKKIWIVTAMLVALLTIPLIVSVIADTQLRAQLTGDQERPDPVKTDATGFATFLISEDGSAITYSFNFTGIENPTEAHVHVGGPEEEGPIIFPLSIDDQQGVLTAKDFRPGGGLQTFDDAVNAMLEGGTYMNIHSQAHPSGEIRGQILPD